MEQDEQYFTEVPEEEYYDDDFTVGDAIFFIVLAVVACAAIGYIIKVFSKSFKNVHLKVGDKINIGIESKE